MQVEIKIDHSYLEPKVVVYTSQMSEEIELLLKQISEGKEVPKILTGMQNEQLKVLNEVDIIRVEANAGKVLARITAATNDKRKPTLLREYFDEEK